MSPDNILNYRINISEEKGHAGYYEAKVQEDIHAKLTVTERTGMASYEYPADQQYGTVIIGGGISATPIEQAAIVITAPNKCEGYAEGATASCREDDFVERKFGHLSSTNSMKFKRVVFISG